MTKIKILPEILASKIAAGEIVERPASVVKELLENSIDAKSNSLEIEIASGGKQLIRVRDDGNGMSHDDAILAFEHHATSKIATAEDLVAIHTLGFRGEALPSIASVSRLSLKTIDPPAAVGTLVEINGGVIKNVKETVWDKGTEVVVEDLFYNVPARRKFLKSNETELTHVTRLVTHYALACPEMAFTLIHQAKELLRCTTAASLKERIFQVFGKNFLSNLVEFHGAQGNAQVYGFASQPHEQRTNPYSQHFFVNKRMVRDRVISHAITQAYKAVIPTSLYPVVVLFVEIPAAEIDVNVHPTKLEIRFRESELIHDLIKNSIQSGLLQTKIFPAYVPGTVFKSERPSPTRNQSEDRFTLETLEPKEQQQAQSFKFDFKQAAQSAQSSAQQATSYVPEPTSTTYLEENPCQKEPLPSMAPLGTNRAEKYELPRGLNRGDLRIVGQLHESFIIAADIDGLLIIDQHVAHERVLYEKTLEEIRADKISGQNLLVPVTFDLTPAQQAHLPSLLPELNRNRFEVETFGGPTLVVKSVPIIASKCDVRLLITEILDSLSIEDQAPGLEQMQEKIAASLACRAAIKINNPLTLEKMQWLVDQLLHAKVSTHCPHGRPIVLRLSMREIEKNFKRI